MYTASLVPRRLEFRSNYRDLTDTLERNLAQNVLKKRTIITSIFTVRLKLPTLELRLYRLMTSALISRVLVQLYHKS